MENILVKYLNESKDLYRLEKATKGSAGFDLLASIKPFRNRGLGNLF